MFDIRHIRHLLAVASHPTLQAAADAVHLTQPALTRSIARLEDQLGARLFDRRGRRLVLTELGERMVARGEGLLRQVRELEEEVALWQGIGTGTVSIGVDPETELSLLPGILRSFVDNHPAVQVSVRSGHSENLLPGLLQGSLHFLVADAELARQRDDLEIQPLAAQPMAAAVRPAHPLARTSAPAAEDIAGYPLAGASTAPRFEQWKDLHRHPLDGEPFKPSLVCDNYEVLAQLAESSDAIVFGPRGLLENYQRLGRLRVMDWPLQAPEVQPCVIRSKSRQLSPAAELLIDLFETSAAAREMEHA